MVLSMSLYICVIHITHPRTLVLSRSLWTSCWVSEQTCCQTFVSMDRPRETFFFPWPCLGISFSVCIPASSSRAISCLHYSWPQFGHQSFSRTSPQLVLTRPLQLCGWCASAPIICLLRPSHTWWRNSTHHSHLSTLSPVLTRSRSLSVHLNLSESHNLGLLWGPQISGWIYRGMSFKVILC